jgi:hypothetical protein
LFAIILRNFRRESDPREAAYCERVIWHQTLIAAFNVSTGEVPCGSGQAWRTEGVRKIAARFGVDPGAVQRISRPSRAPAAKLHR